MCTYFDDVRKPRSVDLYFQHLIGQLNNEKHNCNLPFKVTKNGTGRIKNAPHKSTKQRCLMRIWLSFLKVVDPQLKLNMMVQLEITVIRKMIMIIKHWKGWDSSSTSWTWIFFSDEYSRPGLVEGKSFFMTDKLLLVRFIWWLLHYRPSAAKSSCYEI